MKEWWCSSKLSATPEISRSDMEDWDSQGGVGTCLTAFSSCWWRKANIKIPHVCCSSRNIDSARMQESLISKILQLLQLLNISRLQGKQTWSWGWLQSRMTQPMTQVHVVLCCGIAKTCCVMLIYENIYNIFMKTWHLVSVLLQSPEFPDFFDHFSHFLRSGTLLELNNYKTLLCSVTTGLLYSKPLWQNWCHLS